MNEQELEALIQAAIVLTGHQYEEDRYSEIAQELWDLINELTR